MLFLTDAGSVGDMYEKRKRCIYCYMPERKHEKSKTIIDITLAVGYNKEIAKVSFGLDHDLIVAMVMINRSFR